MKTQNMLGASQGTTTTTYMTKQT